MKIEDKDYLNFVRSLPCSKCFTKPSEAHHENYWLEYGSQRMNDYVAVPLCSKHHRERHEVGAKKFWKGDEKFFFQMLIVHVNYLERSGILKGRSFDDVSSILTVMSTFKLNLQSCEDKTEKDVYNRYSERCVRDLVLKATEFMRQVVKGDDDE